MSNFLKIIIFIYFCQLSGILTCQGGEDSVVEIPNLGKVRGSITCTTWTNRTIHQFLDIKYAKSPINDLRFKPPIGVGKWDDTIDVSKPGNKCSDLSMTSDGFSEDCLSLAVYSNNLEKFNPVMFYIHGGGFFSGGIYRHPPNYLLEKDILLVVPQYRLGPLGFLSLNTSEVPGNVAALDVILALKWVQDNIKYFGGDPTKVTVFGESAGAVLAATLMYSPLVLESYFDKIILQSGGSSSPWGWDILPYENGLQIAQFSKCANEDIDKIVQCLQNLDVKLLWKAFFGHTKMVLSKPEGIHYAGGNRLTFGGYSGFLPDDVYSKLRSTGPTRKYKMMAGFTKHEGTYFLKHIFDSMKDKIKGIKNTQTMVSVLGLVLGNQFIVTLEDSNEVIDAYAKAYAKMFTKEAMNTSDYRLVLDEIIDLSGDISVKIPVLRDFLINQQNNPENSYFYSYEYEGENSYFNLRTKPELYPFKGGVSHGDDLLYLFPYLYKNPLNSLDSQVSKNIIDMWTNFAITGNPGISLPPSTKSNYIEIKDQIRNVNKDIFNLLTTATDEKRSGSNTLAKPVL